jgi:hypothetical protein
VILTKFTFYAIFVKNSKGGERMDIAGIISAIMAIIEQIMAMFSE